MREVVKCDTPIVSSSDHQIAHIARLCPKWGSVGINELSKDTSCGALGGPLLTVEWEDGIRTLRLVSLQQPGDDESPVVFEFDVEERTKIAYSAASHRRR